MKKIRNKLKNTILRRDSVEAAGSRPPKRPPKKTGKSNVLFELLLLGADGSGKSTFIRQMQVRVRYFIY